MSNISGDTRAAQYFIYMMRCSNRMSCAIFWCVMSRRQRTLQKAFVEGFLTNALNPKVSMFYLAAFPQFIALGESSVLASFFLVFLHTVIAAGWFGAMILLFAKLTAVARRGSFQRWLKGVTGVVFVGFGVKLASFRPNI